MLVLNKEHLCLFQGACVYFFTGKKTTHVQLKQHCGSTHMNMCVKDHK